MKNSKTKFIKSKVSTIISGVTIELEENIEISSDLLPDSIFIFST